jgi:hypothetical protein
MRQKARYRLAHEEFRRYSELLPKNACSKEDYETARAAYFLTHYDLKISEIRAKQAKISMEIASTLSALGKQIPICVRRKQSDEDSASGLIKKLTEPSKPSATPVEFATGTKAMIPVENPEPPPPIDPPRPPAPDPVGPPGNPEPPDPQPPQDPPEPVKPPPGGDEDKPPPVKPKP